MVYVSRYVSKINMLTTTVEAICFNYRPKKDNTYPILLRLTKSGKRKYVSLGVSVKEENWDFKKNVPKRSCQKRNSFRQGGRKLIHMSRTLSLDLISTLSG